MCVFVSVCVSILLFLFISRMLLRSALTELPLMFPISFSLLNTPAAFRLAGANIILWLLRELSATNPRSPFSWASALILSSCRPGNNSKKSQSCWLDVISCSGQSGCGLQLDPVTCDFYYINTTTKSHLHNLARHNKPYFA